jgi:hypothetical protein
MSHFESGHGQQVCIVSQTQCTPVDKLSRPPASTTRTKNDPLRNTVKNKETGGGHLYRVIAHWLCTQRVLHGTMDLDWQTLGPNTPFPYSLCAGCMQPHSTHPCVTKHMQHPPMSKHELCTTSSCTIERLQLETPCVHSSQFRVHCAVQPSKTAYDAGSKHSI